MKREAGVGKEAFNDKRELKVDQVIDSLKTLLSNKSKGYIFIVMNEEGASTQMAHNYTETDVLHLVKVLGEIRNTYTQLLLGEKGDLIEEAHEAEKRKEQN